MIELILLLIGFFIGSIAVIFLQKWLYLAAGDEEE